MIICFKGNRFNCFFEAAASLIFHLPTMVQFFSSGVLHENPNKKIQNVSLDVQDKTLMCMVCAVALFFIKITGSYWKPINSDVKYFDFHLYVKRVVTNFEKWIDDPSDLLSPNLLSVFDGGLSIKAPTSHSVHDFVLKNDEENITGCLKCMYVEALEVTKRRLEDFLPGGKFEDVDECIKKQLMHCLLTNFVGESAFGDFDFDVCKRRNASLHNRSSMQSIKRNKTVKFISSKSRSQISRLLGLADKKRKC